ncbi:MAG: hypothetical protein RJA07_1760 [Bacteroidota bacterium]|jgi:N-acetylneuraminic acid mutarotase
MRLLKLFIVLVVVCICHTATAQTPNTWLQKASLPDTGRAGAFAFSIGNKGYLGGGFNNGWQTFLKDFWEYDPATDTWTRKNDLPFGKRALGISFSCNGKGYVGLGQDTLYFDSLYTDLWEYEPITDTWTQKANFPGLGRRYAASFLIDTIGYVGTGESAAGNPLSDFWAYNTTTNIWQQKANFIGTSRMTATAFASSTKGYVGLGTDFFETWKNDWYEYNPTIDAWLQKNNFPGTSRNFALGLNINGKLFLGGEG